MRACLSKEGQFGGLPAVANYGICGFDYLRCRLVSLIDGHETYSGGSADLAQWLSGWSKKGEGGIQVDKFPLEQALANYSQQVKSSLLPIFVFTFLFWNKLTLICHLFFFSHTHTVFYFYKR